jgi:hypothetical protein
MRVSDLSPGLGPAWWQTATGSRSGNRPDVASAPVSVDLAVATKGQYSADAPPDFLAVRSGPGVTPLYSGGYDVVGYVDGEGNNATFFSTGQEGNYAKGVAITYGAQTSASSRASFQQMAMRYLGDHLYDAQDAAGNWNRPTFDVRV